MIEIEPIDSLALTLHHSPGVQALLIGSGISRSAGVPTGWEITLDLIKRLAGVQGIVDEADWATWYQERYGKSPSYSEILDVVAATPAERRSIIHGYVESHVDGELRQPTRAHQAIARLVALGAIRVILTTNFDRLLENALRDAGVEPTVIASDDAIEGAVPLVHSRCTVIKLHGDYLDARIKNTEDELVAYSAKLDNLLDRVLDEYGLLIAGWSGDWDTALRSAITRAPSRRYPFYWSARGDLSTLGGDLLEHRGGKLVRIADADTFFGQLLGKVEALSALNRAHPESIALTVAEGKRLCRDDRFAAEWSDLLATEVYRFSEYLNGPEYFNGSPNDDSINELIRNIVARSEVIRKLVLVSVRWGTDQSFQSTLRAITAITFPDMNGSGYAWVINLRILAASMCFHWAVSAALLREDFGRVGRLMHLALWSRSEKKQLAVSMLPLSSLPGIEWKILKGLERHYTPHSHFFSEIFITESKDVVISKDEAERAWDDAEFLIAAEAGYHRLPAMKEKGLWFWVPSGKFIWQRERTTLEDRMAHMESLTSDSPELKAGLFGGTVSGVEETHGNLKSFFQEVGSRWF
ncbi:hypothetical protein M2333_001816 [Sphingobium sp. B11D3B]|uniref:SIR2 family protein n=1 Tax=Sphingobium sp. B11D3B TaxID=2940575 RepID=UPI002226DC35|nr:SIR2 family protein [Sphingobium sp. B11D3B]MCW2388770.1 hypothetical protein [Sphingobium sp. B11D3B]